VRPWSAARLAALGGTQVLHGAPAGPVRAVIDSRSVEPGDLFVGLPGEHVDGGAFAGAALEAGAWGVLVAPEHARGLPAGRGAVLAAPEPLGALHALARAWRRELGAVVIAVTGSVGKTSTKELVAAMVRRHRTVVASRANFNTEIGLPLELLGAPPGTEVLVLELAMRGFGQIAELAAICEPDVGVITNIAPVHLEKVGSLEGVARAKGELLGGLRAGATAVLPAGEALLDPWLTAGLERVTFGPGGDVDWAPGEDGRAVIAQGERLALELPFTQRHNLTNALAAVAAARAAGVRPEGRVDVAFGALRGERVELGDGVVLINDCYNANPLSMRAALDDLALQEPAGRRVAVLGDMLELGPEEVQHHREVGAHAGRAGVEVLVTVGRRAAVMAEVYDGEVHAVEDAAEAARIVSGLLRPGDLVLVKGSRGVGLEVVAAALAGKAGG
jgi:UDP-N-acetylmuramoyl-tripeptide--D-alanyl-D-alanine ligase